MIINFHFECKVEHDEKAYWLKLKAVESGGFDYEAHLRMRALSLYCPLSTHIRNRFVMTLQELDAIKDRQGLALESTRTLAAEFVDMRLAIGFAFARLFVLHRSNQNSPKALESRCRAQEALKTALTFLHRARLPDWKLKEVTERIMALEKLLYLA